MLWVPGKKFAQPETTDLISNVAANAKQIFFFNFRNIINVLFLSKIIFRASVS